MSVRKQCTGCSGTAARGCHVYVITRADKPWSKIGTANLVGNRMANYRGKGIVPTVKHSMRFCCEFAARTVERAAHARLDRSHSRMQGDWFDALPADSVAAINLALKSASVRAYL